MLDIGYANYIIVLLIITGILILLLDVKAFNEAKMKKEKKFSQFLGWINITIGVGLFVANWTYQNLLW
ncbi:CLC_0170 family protein [Bacillus sp. FSL K6-3431]|uniref:CLC_0170 family protein n=1 Tax=Bacillus sp. FSL K6-3431 TaxID=2921500 RepID=UPI0030F854BB